jgi:hypothetical protein
MAAPSPIGGGLRRAPRQGASPDSLDPVPGSRMPA